MTTAAGERMGAALVIGIGAYGLAEQVRPLRFAARDAEAMAEALTDSDVCRFPAGKVKLLTDSAAGRDTVAHHLSKWLPEQGRGAEIAVIYFAGHGMIRRVGPREEGYLLSYDADPEDLVTRGIFMTDVARWVEAIEARAVVVCLDACHAAKVIARGEAGTGSIPGVGSAGADLAARDMRIRPGMLQALAGRGRYLIAACDEGQVSVESEAWGHGLFTYHLLEGLRGAGDRDGDGRVGINELFEYVAEAVERDARAVGAVQRPWSSAIGPGGVFLSELAPRTLPGTPQPSGPGIDAGHGSVSGSDSGSSRIPEPERGGHDRPAAVLIARLDGLRRRRDPAAIPEIFAALVHEAKEVREHAKLAARALGWEKTSAAILELARQGLADPLRSVLEGLAAFESHRDVVALLDRLVVLLKGDLRNQAILMLDRKRLVLEMEKTAAVFRAIQSPLRLTRVLGQGLFTSAFAARDEEDGLDVVVRVLRPEFAGQPQLRAMFLDIARQSRRIVHQNLVLTREVRGFPEQEIYFVVRDHVPGVTLQSAVFAGREFPQGTMIGILRQAAEALEALHRWGLVHRGVKPSNIFLADEDRVVLGDPTLPVPALGASMERLSYDYRYAAPELFQGSGSAGPAADWYALGCVAYELACGRPPFVADNPFELANLQVSRAPEVPSRLGSRLGISSDALLLRLLAKSPFQRPANAGDVLRDLAALDRIVPSVRDRPGAEPASEREERPADLPAALERTESFDDHGGDDLRVGTGLDSEPSTASGPAPPSRPHRLEEADSIFSFDPHTLAPSQEEREEPIFSGLEAPRLRLGSYQILRKLGQGGMGTVYLGRDLGLDRVVAIKVMENRGRADGNAAARFRREARAVARLTHPGIIQIYQVGEQDGTLFIALEYVGGGSLRERLRREGPMPPEPAARLVLELALAVHAAHAQSIIHRDLKPSNILLTEAGEPKISDFGLAKLLDQVWDDDLAALTLGGAPIGTPGYMAPEQVRGESIGPATDIYGLGAILYECLTGRGPFHAQGKASVEILYRVIEQRPTPPRQIRPEIPPALERICLRCLEKDPGRRYAGADQLARALAQFLTSPEPEEPAVTATAESPQTLSPPRVDRPRLRDRLRSWWAGARPSTPPDRRDR